jgi:hypothetical protein
MIPALAAAALALSTEVVTVDGSGCRIGTAAVAPDDKAFTVTRGDYLARIGPDSRPADFRKNRRLNLKVNVPGGFTCGVAQADCRGFAHLERGAQGTHKTDVASIVHHFAWKKCPK